MTLSVAIVGSGPAGFYTADALLRADDGCRVDIIDRLPTPYGLIRFGVAPDHEKTKNVMRGFARTAADDRVNFYGDVDVGDALSLDELRGMYDAVVLAVGAAHDRRLGIPGEDKAGVVGSASFVNWYNAHPDFVDRTPDLDTSSVVIIGAGNVAIDVARVLVKTPAEMAATGLARLCRSPHSRRADRRRPTWWRGAARSKPSSPMSSCARWAGSRRACPRSPPPTCRRASPARCRRATGGCARRTSRRCAASRSGRPTRCRSACISCSSRARSRFWATRKPRRCASSARGSRTAAPSAPASISRYRAAWWSRPSATSPCPSTARPSTAGTGVVVNDEGRVEPGLYAVGWIKRGPTGVIGTNKPDGRNAAEQILADLGAGGGEGGGGKPGRDALEALLRARGCRWVDFEDWRRIEAAEIAAAAEGAPRRKLYRREDFLAVLDERRAAG